MSCRVNPLWPPVAVPEPPSIHLSLAMIFAVKFKILFQSFFHGFTFHKHGDEAAGHAKRSREKRRRQKRKAYHIFLAMGQILKSCLQANSTIRDIRDLNTTSGRFPRKSSLKCNLLRKDYAGSIQQVKFLARRLPKAFFTRSQYANYIPKA